MHNLKLEAVTVSVGYGDFLSVAAPFNAPLFDRWVVVTEAGDHETRDVCRRHRLHCVVSEDARREGPKEFNKGRLVERGLQHLSEGAYRLHLDADVVLPATARQLLSAAHLDPACVYGCDRFSCPEDAWLRLRDSAWLRGASHDWPNLVAPPAGLKMGSRLVTPDGGYVPIGFFQLWHGSEDECYGVRHRPYPSTSSGAHHSDVQFALQWDRRRRLLLPELFALHLESEECAPGTNWRGRKTKRFAHAPKYQPSSDAAHSSLS